MKIVIIGSDGQLGTDLLKCREDLIGLTIKNIDITNYDQSNDVLAKISPDVVINTAAYNQVDMAEDNSDQAFLVNETGAKNLAIICKEISASLVHVSTDYVFSGDKKGAYVESDEPSPQSIYGKSKLAGEKAVQSLISNYFIVRTSGLYGVAGCMGKGGGNFVENIIKKAKDNQQLKIVDDEIVSTTYSKDLALKIFEILDKQEFGLYHVANNGSCSWYDFAEKIFGLLKLKVNLTRTNSSQFKSKAKRPKFSVLQSERLQPMRPWQEALEAYLREKGHIS